MGRPRGARSNLCLIGASPEFGPRHSPDHASTQKPGIAFLDVVGIFVTNRGTRRGLLGSLPLSRDYEEHDECKGERVNDT